MDKKNRILNVFSLMINLTVIISVAYAIAHNFRADILINEEDEITVGSELLNFRGWTCLRFFTNLSNILAAIACVTTLVFNVKNAVRDEYLFPRWVTLLKFSAITSIFLTFITVTVFLSPLIAFTGKSYFLLFKGNSFFVHFFNPVLAAAGFLTCERDGALSFKDSLIAVTPVLLYAVLYTVMVVVVKAWPDFYSFTFGGRLWAIAVSVPVMLGGSLGIANLLRAIRKKAVKPQPETEKEKEEDGTEEVSA